MLRAPAAKAKPGYNAKTSRVLPAQTSADQVVYQNADGTRTAMAYQWPRFYRLADGTWASIDTNLVAGPGSRGAGGSPGQRQSDGAKAATSTVTAYLSAAPSPSPSPSLSPAPSLAPSPSPSPSGSSTPAAPAVPSASPASTPASAPDGWRVKAAAAEESFAPYADAGTLVDLPLGGSASVGFGVQGAAHAAGSASGDTVSYPGALPGSDLRYLAGSGVVTEQLILGSRSAASSYVFPLTLAGGVRAAQKPGGPVEFTSSSGKVVAVVEPGYMTDSDIDPHSGNGAYSAGVTYTLVKADGRPAIKMTLDSAWLDASARVFPVTVDPSVSDVNSNGTTYVESPESARLLRRIQRSTSGTYDGGSNVAKSFLKFDSVSSTLKNDTSKARCWGCSTRGPTVAPRARCTCTR